MRSIEVVITLRQFTRFDTVIFEHLSNTYRDKFCNTLMSAGPPAVGWGTGVGGLRGTIGCLPFYERQPFKWQKQVVMRFIGNTFSEFEVL